jgi:hypothetical protein
MLNVECFGSGVQCAHFFGEIFSPGEGRVQGLLGFAHTFIKIACRTPALT